MSYVNGKLIRYNGSAWLPSASEDFFFRVYLQAPVAPTKTEVNVDYLSGVYKGLVLNDNNHLTTDIKFLLATLVDDTVSISWSDPKVENVYDLKDRLPDFFANILNRTKTATIPGYTGKYPISYVDFWIFSNTEINRSLGFTNLIEDIQTYAFSLFERGLSSTLLGSVPLITNGLNEQSVYDAFFGENSAANSVRVNNLVSYLNSLGLLRLNDIFSYWQSINSVIRSSWGTGKSVNTHAEVLKNTIKDYLDVSEYVVRRWAKSFIPLAFVVADGDSSSSEDVSIAVQSANSSWNDLGSPIFTFGLGKSHSENYLRSMSSGTDGNHFYISSETDWDDAETALLHSGNFNLFSGFALKTYDFTDLTWISQIDATFTPTSPLGNGASCLVEVRWSIDRVNFTSWSPVTSGTPFILKKLIYVLEYKITMKDGWDGTNSVRPVITTLKHTIISPSVQYLFTPPQKVDGMIFENLLSTVAFLPETATARWGISRGDSIDFADYAVVHQSRKGALPNRQSGILFSEEVLFDRLPATQSDTDGFIYTVFYNNAPKTWVNNRDIITVYRRTNAFDSEIVMPDTQYIANGNNGTITFNNAQNFALITVSIKTPSTIYTSRGETTSTKDYKTYYLTNGRWSRDSKIIVLVNDKIVRGGYWASPEEGTITFTKEREETDVVSAYIQFSEQFRVGVEIKNYDPSVDSQGNPIPLEIKNFALMFNSLQNVKLESEFSNTIAPFVTDSVILPRAFQPNGTLINPTIYQRLTLSYKFNSADNAIEDGTTISWWRYRIGQSTSGLETRVYDNKTFIKLNDYDNRITQKKSDVGNIEKFGDGDLIFIEIIPSDGFSIGQAVSTDLVTLAGDKVPFILTLKKPVNVNTSSPTIVAPEDSVSWNLTASSSSTSFLEPGTYYAGFSYFNTVGETPISRLKSIVLSSFQAINFSSLNLPQNATGINYYISPSPGAKIDLQGSFNSNSASDVVTGVNTKFTAELKAGDSIYTLSNGFLGIVKFTPTSDTTLQLTANATANYNGAAKLLPVFLGQSNTGNVVTVITELTENVYPISANMTRDSTTGLRSAPVTDEISAFYVYRNPDNSDNVPDATIVQWYLKDNESNVIYTGKTVPANTFKAGSSYIFKATPYNNSRYGTEVWSSTVLITARG